MLTQVQTKISVHSYRLFSLFINANFGSAIEVGHYSVRNGPIIETYVEYSYDDEDPEYRYIRLKMGFNGHLNLEQAFLDYEHTIRHMA